MFIFCRFDIHRMFGKVTRHIDFPEKLNIRPYMSVKQVCDLSRQVSSKWTVSILQSLYDLGVNFVFKFVPSARAFNYLQKRHNLHRPRLKIMHCRIW